jgi:hypothetical protein
MVIDTIRGSFIQAVPVSGSLEPNSQLWRSGDVTARQAVLDAFKRLENRTGWPEFTIQQIVEEVRSTTGEYQETTIRTYVTSVMCVDAPVHHANHTDDLVRVGRGVYRRVEPGDDLADRRREADSRIKDQPREQAKTGDPQAEWY